MGLSVLKAELEKLCYDLEDDISLEEVIERTGDLYSKVIHDKGWLEKNGHLQVRACKALYDAKTEAIKGNYREALCLVNEAQGRLETAVQIEQEEWSKGGIPKPLKVVDPQEETFREWMEDVGLDDSYDGSFITAKDLYDLYVEWMDEFAEGEEVMTSNAFGKSLSSEEFRKSSKWVEGKAVKVWLVVQNNR